METREGRREGRWNRLNIARERIQRCVASESRAREDEGGDGGGGDCRETRFEKAIGSIGLDWIGSGDAVGDSTWETRVSNARLTAVCAFRDVSRA